MEKLNNWLDNRLHGEKREGKEEYTLYDIFVFLLFYVGNIFKLLLLLVFAFLPFFGIYTKIVWEGAELSIVVAAFILFFISIFTTTVIYGIFVFYKDLISDYQSVYVGKKYLSVRFGFLTAQKIAISKIEDYELGWYPILALPFIEKKLPINSYNNLKSGGYCVKISLKSGRKIRFRKIFSTDKHAQEFMEALWSVRPKDLDNTSDVSSSLVRHIRAIKPDQPFIYREQPDDNLNSIWWTIISIGLFIFLSKIPGMSMDIVWFVAQIIVIPFTFILINKLKTYRDVYFEIRSGAILMGNMLFHKRFYRHQIEVLELIEKQSKTSIMLIEKSGKSHYFPLRFDNKEVAEAYKDFMWMKLAQPAS